MAMSWLNGSCINQPEDSNSPVKPQGPRSKLQCHVPMVRKEASPLLSCLRGGSDLDDEGTDRARPAGASSKKMKARVWILSRGGFQHFSRVDIAVVRMISLRGRVAVHLSRDTIGFNGVQLRCGATAECNGASPLLATEGSAIMARVFHGENLADHRMFCKLQSLGWPARSSPQHSQESGMSLSTIGWMLMKNEKFPYSLLSSDQDQSDYMDVDDEDVDCSLETLRISVILEMFDMTLESCCGSGNDIAGFQSHW
ncbi:hypothetical protein JB92DRAFT_2825598 [Gautieria morchelliformis]|nr:hypothetical protein JB92DRAFT_2825598 [Gautieria morchelliformis]